MNCVIKMAPDKAEEGSRTGRTRAARQRSRGPFWARRPRSL